MDLPQFLLIDYYIGSKFWGRVQPGNRVKWPSLWVEKVAGSWEPSGSLL